MWFYYYRIFGFVILAKLQSANAQRELGDVDLGCPQSSYLHGNFCYVVTPIFVTYEDAEIICETGGGLLAAVKDTDTQQFLHKLRVRKFLHRYWFGLNDKKIEGEWVYSDNTRMSSFSKWHRGEPNNFGKTQHCANLWLERHLEWDDEDCARKMLYICEYDEFNCTDGQAMYGKSCYEVSNDFLSYDEAEIQCAQKGGFLAMIKTEGTFNFIKSLIYADRFWLNMTDKQIQGIMRDQSTKVSWVIDTWIGARFMNGEWINSDGTPVVYTNWAPGEPFNTRNLEDCVKLGQLWNDVQCDLRHGFICQYPVRTDTKSSIPSLGCTFSSIDREDVPTPRELESRLASATKNNDDHTRTSEVHLGITQFTLILIGCGLLGMILIAMAFTVVIYHRHHQDGSHVLNDEQDLEILRYPEVDDQ